jgi:hypothetical protein
VTVVPSIAVDGFSSCHLKRDGTLLCWGNQYYVPEFNDRRYRALSHGWAFCAQRLDGSVLCSSRSRGSSDDDYVVEGLPLFEQMRGGGPNHCGLVGGNLHCWNRSAKPTLVASDVVAFDVSEQYLCLINSAGVLSCPGTLSGTFPIAAAAGKFKQVQCVTTDCCALATDGTVGDVLGLL